MTQQRIPFVLVKEVKDGNYSVELWTTNPPHAPGDTPLLTIQCAGFDTGALDLGSGDKNAAPLTLWDSTGEKITTVYPRLSALEVGPGRRYIPQPYYDPDLQQARS